jgi:hypothetical protein
VTMLSRGEKGLVSLPHGLGWGAAGHAQVLMHVFPHIVLLPQRERGGRHEGVDHSLAPMITWISIITHHVLAVRRAVGIKRPVEVPQQDLDRGPRLHALDVSPAPTPHKRRRDRAPYHPSVLMEGCNR